MALSYRNERFASFIAEWKSTWQAYQNGESDVLALWLLIALCLLGLALRRPLYLPDLLIVGFSAYFACAHLRSVAFFAVALAPTTAYYLDRGLLRRLGRRSAVAFQSLAALGVLCALLLGAWQLRQRPGQQLLDPQLPVAVADFIEQAPLMGRMFNHYDWGGYLLWRLSPERRVFIDGRSLDLGVLEDYITIASALDSGSGGWRRLLERHRVDYVVLPLFQTNGLIPPLAKVLLVDRQWTPIYLDHLALVFLRRDPAHRPQLEQYGRSTSEFASQWLSRLDGFVAGNPGDPRMYLARGELRLWLNQRAQARQDFVRGLALDPGNRYMSYYLQLIERGAPSGG